MKICPNLVMNDPNGEPFTIFYQYLPIILLKEIQRLMERVEKLEKAHL
jgi:hypothetical protein